MHEIDMTKALIQTVREWVRSQPDHFKVETIHLTVGKFTCVEPASLKFAFSVQTKNTDLDGVNLIASILLGAIVFVNGLPNCDRATRSVKSQKLRVRAFQLLVMS